MTDSVHSMYLQAVFGKKPTKRSKPTGEGATFRDPRFYLNYEQEGAATEAGQALTLSIPLFSAD